MNRFILGILFSLALCSIATAAENPRHLFARIKARTQHIDKVALVIASELPNDSLVFSAMTPEEGCTVYFSSQIVMKASTAELAVLMGHELAHCELDHHRQFRETSEAELLRKQWEFEYEADDLGLKLVHRIVPGTRTAFEQILSTLPRGVRHPSGRDRLKAVRTSERAYPVETVAAR